MIDARLEARTCPICHERDASHPVAEANVDLRRLDAFAFASRKLPEYMHWRLAECGRCDLLYADPAPHPDVLAQLYRGAAYDSREEAGHASRTYGALLPRIAEPLPDRVGAVDVGTGEGSFLRELLAAGFTEVAGVEPSEAPIAAADPEVRPLIRNEMFRADAFPPGSLSLLSCFQTIEHLHDPLDFCRAAMAPLKPGGALFLIGHDRRAAANRLLGRRSPIFDIEHMQLFSPKSFENLLRAAGFDRVEIFGISNRYPLRYWARLFPLPGPLKRPVVGGLDRSALGRMVVGLPTGNLAAVGYKPG